MTEVILFTQETFGACTTQRAKNEGIEDDFPDVQFREVDIRADLEAAIERADQQPTGLTHRLASIVRR